MAKRRKVIRAGRLVYAAVYSTVHPSDSPEARAAKTKCSTAARQRMNMKYAWQKLELLLASNFTPRDLVVTLTYDDDHLPDDRDGAVEKIKRFWVQLRKARRLAGQSLHYVYVTEGVHGDKRLHHHVVIDGTGGDLETLQSLWPHGEVHIEYVDAYGYEALAKYLTKEPREHGSPNGLRSWTPSRGLEKPERESGWVPDDVTLCAPPGATVLDSDSMVNQWGEVKYLKYLLPERRPERKTRPRRSKPRKTA